MLEKLFSKKEREKLKNIGEVHSMVKEYSKEDINSMSNEKINSRFKEISKKEKEIKKDYSDIIKIILTGSRRTKIFLYSLLIILTSSIVLTYDMKIPSNNLIKVFINKTIIFLFLIGIFIFLYQGLLVLNKQIIENKILDNYNTTSEELLSFPKDIAMLRHTYINSISDESIIETKYFNTEDESNEE